MIIAFGHEKLVGKDTACRFLATHLRTVVKAKSVEKRAFADKLKQMCFELYAWAGLMQGSYYEEHPELKEVVLPLLGLSPRQIWIKFGTLVVREVYPKSWISYLFNNSKADYLFLSDMRFPEEADEVRFRGGIVIRILRPSILHTSDLADDPLLDYKNWSHTIINDGSLHDFHKKVIDVFERVQKDC
jgi:hypothetical protein